MGKKILRFLYITAFIFSLFFATAFYQTSKPLKNLAHYYDSGKYSADVSNVIKEATFYLQLRLTQNHRTQHPQKLAIVMDIDETALSNYNKLLQKNFDIDAATLQKIQSYGYQPAILHTLALYNYAKDHDIAVFFITGRLHTIKTHTITNLKNIGYHHWGGISFNHEKSIGSNTIKYRETERKKIKEQGYDIIMNLGNRKSTLAGNFADMKFKLPNPFYHFT